MIIIKSDPEIDIMRQAGRITAGARTIARQMVAPGVTTRQINREVHKFITKSGATPCFMTDGGFPTAACISVNDEIIHGIPGDRVLHEGDIVSVDVGARYRGFNGDCAGTFPCGQCSDEALRLIRITRQSFFEGIRFAVSATASPISATPFRIMPRAMAIHSCASMSATASAPACMKRRRSRTTASPATDRVCRRT